MITDEGGWDHGVTENREIVGMTAISADQETQSESLKGLREYQLTDVYSYPSSRSSGEATYAAHEGLPPRKRNRSDGATDRIEALSARSSSTAGGDSRLSALVFESTIDWNHTRGRLSEQALQNLSC
jgi:hypothetical protein